MELRLVVLADAANISQEGKLNLTGIFDSISTIEEKPVWPALNLVFILRANGSEVGPHTFMVRLVDADGAILLDLSGVFEVPPPWMPGYASSVRFLFPFRGIQFPGAGDYSFDVFIDQRYLDSAPLFIRPP